jgi:hypothetical protein
LRTFATFLKEDSNDIRLNPVPGTQYGSNPGGVHTDEAGDKHYVKFYRNHDQAKSEVLASKIYQHMGAKTTSPELKRVNGKHAVVTKWNDHLETMHPHDFEHLNKSQAHDVGRKYHAAILTKNWDAVGLEHDNITRHKGTGELHTVDTGGTFNFRAMGSHKEYGPDIEEHKSLRNMHGTAASHVFNHVFKHHPDAEAAGVHAVRQMDDQHVHELFKNSGLSNHEELHKNFVAKKAKLLAHYDSQK